MDTKIRERVSAQLRLEIFNLFNTRDLAAPDRPAVGLKTSSNELSSSGLGQINSTLGNAIGAPRIGTGEPRNVQLALKLVF